MRANHSQASTATAGGKTKERKGRNRTHRTESNNTIREEEGTKAFNTPPLEQRLNKRSIIISKTTQGRTSKEKKEKTHVGDQDR